MSETIFDFRREQAATAWQPVNDVVMGGCSQACFGFDPDGFCIFSGTVSLENNGGFASVHSGLIESDFPDGIGLALTCRGDGKEYKLCLRPDAGFDGCVWQARFSASPEWQKHCSPWDIFIPSYHGRPVTGQSFDPRQIKRAGLLIARQPGDFRLDLKELKLLE